MLPIGLYTIEVSHSSFTHGWSSHRTLVRREKSYSFGRKYFWKIFQFFFIIFLFFLFQVIAFICGLIVIILMIMGLASTDWLMAAGWRQGLFMHCIEEDAPQPLPFNMQEPPGCYQSRDAGEGWINHQKKKRNKMKNLLQLISRLRQLYALSLLSLTWRPQFSPDLV